LARRDHPCSTPWRDEGSLREALRERLLTVMEGKHHGAFPLHYGCPPERMELVRAHRAVEGGHRKDAWSALLDHLHDQATADAVGDAVEEARILWLRYRDGVARAMDVPVGPS
jgi:hypothetical protein